MGGADDTPFTGRGCERAEPRPWGAISHPTISHPAIPQPIQAHAQQRPFTASAVRPSAVRPSAVRRRGRSQPAVVHSQDVAVGRRCSHPPAGTPNIHTRLHTRPHTCLHTCLHPSSRPPPSAESDPSPRTQPPIHGRDGHSQRRSQRPFTGRAPRTRPSWRGV